MELSKLKPTTVYKMNIFDMEFYPKFTNGLFKN